MATISASSASGFIDFDFPRFIGGNIAWPNRGRSALVKDFRQVYGRRRFLLTYRRCRNESLAGRTGSDSQPGSLYKKQFRGFAWRLGDTVRSFLEKFDRKGRKEEQKLDLEWQNWVKYFDLVDRDEKMLASLKVHLADAVKSEDYEEAAKLKLLIMEKMANDSAGKLMNKMMEAIKEEQYNKAIHYRDDTVAGLVGWWAGFADNADDPYGKIIHIVPQHGKFVATGYNARQLAAGMPGVPLFEIFIKEDNDNGYKQQAVYLQPYVKSRHDNRPRAPKAANMLEIEKEKADEPDSEDEGLQHVLRFLRKRMPGLNFKVMKTAAQSQTNKDLLSGVLEQFIQDVIEQREEEIMSFEASSREHDGSDLPYDKVIAEGNINFMQHIEVAAAKVAIGSLIQRIAEDAPLTAPVRIPAKIERMTHEAFCFHIHDNNSQTSRNGRKPIPSWRISATASQTSCDSMLSKGVTNVGSVSIKALEDLGEIITLAVSEAQKRRSLLGSTVFHHINIEAANSDPFSGLYAHSFGPYTSEIIQLRHKFGQWHNSADTNIVKDSQLEFYEYVEAVKLTGDGSVPAGQVIFRAKIGKENQLPCQDIFTEHLGVFARYKGQELQPFSGFRKSKWIDAELLLLDDKGIGQAGPHLGFLSSHHIIPVLFNRLKLSQ
eukprot:TRINITY_DN13225_c0_g1_i1.p1 TRINITY_DN13225_c0_g1~~TRINITY_DN13225_c0_g1_i1.p1  ORF type:complete len:658 (+),score=131.31 TRINITY_DN13225_c0_g1_i1:351-2324(+)